MALSRMTADCRKSTISCRQKTTLCEGAMCHAKLVWVALRPKTAPHGAHCWHPTPHGAHPLPCGRPCVVSTGACILSGERVWCQRERLWVPRRLLADACAPCTRGLCRLPWSGRLHSALSCSRVVAILVCLLHSLLAAHATLRPDCLALILIVMHSSQHPSRQAFTSSDGAN